MERQKHTKYLELVNEIIVKTITDIGECYVVENYAKEAFRD